MIRGFQKYDQKAAIITRKIRSPRMNRYTWPAKNTANFQDLANQISTANKQGVRKLYYFIHQSETLEEINESLQHGHTSLKTHILLTVNLIVQEFLNLRNLTQESDYAVRYFLNVAYKELIGNVIEPSVKAPIEKKTS